MGSGPECLQKAVESLFPEEGQKEEKKFLPKMVKLESLKKSEHFRKVLKGKKINTDFFLIFAKKSVIQPKVDHLNISFVMKKKIGNSVKRNKIKRKLKAIVQKFSKKKGAINRDYTYIVFGKSNAYAQKQNVLMPLMEESFNRLKK